MISWFKRVGKKFGNATKGLIVMIKEEKSLWVHLFVTIIVFILGITLFEYEDGNNDTWKWVAIIFTISLVIGFEILNTAIEYLVDIVSFEYNVKAKKIKDVAAMATLVVTIASIIIGLIIFIPEFTEMFN